MEPYIKLQKVKKSYGSVEVLRGINLQVAARELCVLRGASGSGKSTLLYLLAGLELPSSGKLEVGGRDLSQLSDDALAHYRNKQVGLIFQHHFLLPALTCFKNIWLPLELGGKNSLNPSIDYKNEIFDLAQYLGVSHCLQKYPGEISGGEQQRINLIRAVFKRPELLLCDEPTGNLDSKNAEKVMEILLSLSKKFQMTLIVVTHDAQVAKHFPREILICDGLVV